MVGQHPVLWIWIPASVGFGLTTATATLLGAVWQATDGGRRELGDRLAIVRHATTVCRAPRQAVQAALHTWLETHGVADEVVEEAGRVVIRGSFGTWRTGQARVELRMVDNGDGTTVVGVSTGPYWRTHVFSNGQSVAAVDGVVEVLRDLPTEPADPPAERDSSATGRRASAIEGTAF